MITLADIAEIEPFASLPPDVRSRLASRSAEVIVKASEWIVHYGDPPYFWVILEGEVEAVRIASGREQQTTTFDPGEYFGEVPLMLGAAALTGVRALKASRLMRVDPSDFHAMISTSSEAAAQLAQSMARRVSFIGDAYNSSYVTQATIVGSRYDFECHDIRDFLSRNQIVFEWLDPSDESDAAMIPQDIKSSDAHPVVLLAGGRRLHSPKQRELAEVLGLQTVATKDCYDVVIIGGGPAGLAAAVYGGSEGLHTIMIEREAPGGQAGTSSRIENYLGFPGGVSGGDLANRALLQAKRFGTEILVTRSVKSIETTDDEHVVVLDGDERIHTRTVVIATGVAWRKLESEGAEQFVGRGVYYGAARTESLAVRGKDIVLIGGGNSAGQAAMFFSNYARSVTLLCRGEGLGSSMSHYLIEQIDGKSNITVEPNTVVTKIAGGQHVETVATKDVKTGIETERCADAIFAFIGADAETSWLPDAIERDALGYIRTGPEVERRPAERAVYALETSVPGIFAAGDVRSNSIKRVASGVGEGSMVIAFVHQYLEYLARRAKVEA